MNLTAEVSARGVELALGMVRVLREEYADGMRDRRGVDRLLARWTAEVEKLPPAESRKLLQAVRPLAKGYSGMSGGERKHVLVEVGNSLKRLAGAEAPASKVEAARPPAGQAVLRLEDDLQYLKGIGPQLAKRLLKLDLHTVEDLLLHFPRRWEDRTQIRPIGLVRDGAVETVEGKVGSVNTKVPRPGMKILQALLSDNTGSLILTWFNQPHVAKQLLTGQTLAATGKVERRFSETQMQSPEIETGGERIHSGRVVPVYPLTGNVSQKWLRQVMFRVVPTYARKLKEPLPAWLRADLDLMSRGEAVEQYHWPQNYDLRERARTRLAFEELFTLQLEIGVERLGVEREPRTVRYAEVDVEEFERLLPFPPTGAQRRSMRELLEDLQRDTPMNRLLQGDVGAGKTVVAAFAAWVAVKNGYQAAVMAPTEILADQHFHKFQELMGETRVGRLSGSMTKRQKRQMYDALQAGLVDVVVGTHALIQEGVEFRQLAMTVVDEQHKFGVMQRTVLKQKGLNPDLLVMTATPIPRTLALTLYGDLEVSRLDEMPPGRQPIHSESVPFSERARVYEDIRREIRAGRQAYIICPLVEESENVEATAAVEEAGVLQQRVFPEFSVGLLHGRMKSAEKEAVMERFRQGEHQILISTTVIEVGVDVPNATFMLVQDANRFGLAQLHQLRGRVGRGQHASRCVFMGDAASEEGQRRLRAIARMSDGFDVAEEDLQIRGPGDFYGLRQSGFPELKVADLLRDMDLLDRARAAVKQILERDPELALADHAGLRDLLEVRSVKSAELIH
ncbi:MAG: ATP-dependent DNA helicase RecG [Candidatus Eremiobacterota bacterium]